MSAFENSNEVDDLEPEREVREPVPQTTLRGEMDDLSDDEKVKANNDDLDGEDTIPSVEESQEGKLLLSRVHKPQTIRLSRTYIQKQNNSKPKRRSAKWLPWSIWRTKEPPSKSKCTLLRHITAISHLIDCNPMVEVKSKG